MNKSGKVLDGGGTFVKRQNEVLLQVGSTPNEVKLSLDNNLTMESGYVKLDMLEAKMLGEFLLSKYKDWEGELYGRA